MDNGFAERLRVVTERIEAACARAGRDRAGVQLVAVSKTHGPDRIREAAECGLTVFGESKVQEAQVKIPQCPGNLSWHFVGHLQRNKTAVAAQLFDCIHSVDSARLLETVDRASAEAGKVMPVLLEVNVSGERSKYGMPPEEVPGVLALANGLDHVEVRGLMTMPPFTEDPAEAQPWFRQLREWRDRWRGETGFALDELSMGMTHDLEVAVEEGATWVRVGTALFGERERA
ncbi:MAG: YggS family pyridoxal phosphate-dependent enzyme [Verrucomicrobia bacterium]|nr:YggS family pyridoxal phosphate-dependent enzyme [Verrucomicrobiota bacterium]MBU1908417.1 YggS family pyridoxal phosphate-dependent enzyme [Verrucomicrobiota bacterium]